MILSPDLAITFLMCNKEESISVEIDNCPLKLFILSKMGLETVLLDVSAEPPQLSLIDETSGKFALAQNFCQEKVRILHLAIMDITHSISDCSSPQCSMYKQNLHQLNNMIKI